MTDLFIGNSLVSILSTNCMKSILLCFVLTLLLNVFSAQSQPLAFEKIDKILIDSVPNIVSPSLGASLTIYLDNELVYNKSFGAERYTPTFAVPIASATKWMSACVIMKLVELKVLSLDDPITKYLSTFNDKKGIPTIRHLMCHTSGYEGVNTGHQNNAKLTLEEAVNLILEEYELKNVPGTSFAYGGISMQIAGRIAEIATKKPWDTLWYQYFAQPMGLTQTNFEGFGETDNPHIAGGGSSSGFEYAQLLRMIYNNGRYNGKQILSKQSIDTMLADHIANAKIERSPAENWTNLLPSFVNIRYGIGNWVEEKQANTNIGIINSSIGIFGFSPWIDKRRKMVGVFSTLESLNKIMPTYIQVRLAINALVDNQEISIPTDISSKSKELYFSHASMSKSVFKYRIEAENTSEPISLTMFSANGTVVFTATNVDILENELVLPSGCATGMYLVYIAQGESAYSIVKVIHE